MTMASLYPATGAPGAEPSGWREWDAFVEGAPRAGFMQSSWWADFRATHGYGHFLLMLKHERHIVGGALVLRFEHAPGHCFYTIPEGPVLPDDEDAAGRVFAAIEEAVVERSTHDPAKVSHLRIEPRWPSLPRFVSGYHAPPFVDSHAEPRRTRCVDLRPRESEILGQMKSKGRYNVRLAARRGVTVEAATSVDALPDFLDVYGDTVDRQRIDAKPASYFENLAATLFPARRGALFFARLGGRPIATAMVVLHGRRATYFFGGSSSDHREVMAPYALHFEIMRTVKALGYRSYDLWGIAPRNEPDHPWRGISEFKSKFGGDEIDLVPTLDKVLDPGAYRGYLDREELS